MVFNTGETLQYYWDQTLRCLGLWPSEEPSDDESVLPPVSSSLSSFTLTHQSGQISLPTD